MADNSPASINVVLVHGAFVDGSGWEGTYRALTAKGFTVSVVQHPTATLAGDVGYVTRAVEAHDGPAILVGHSYGGVVITEAGRHPQVKALVYVAAWLPDAGESVNALIAKLPQDGPLPPLAPRDGFLFVDPAKFPDAFAQDVDVPRRSSRRSPSCRGRSRPPAAPSASRRGRPGRAGIWSRLTTA